jgi:hypothetical protein
MDLIHAKAIIYCRKSTDTEDNQILSIESQIDECLKLARKYAISDYIIVKEMKSAKSPDRPLFKDMVLKFYQKKYDTIICWKLDRLSRNPIDGGQLIWLLQKDFIKHIITSNQIYNAKDNQLSFHMFEILKGFQKNHDILNLFPSEKEKIKLINFMIKKENYSNLNKDNEIDNKERVDYLLGLKQIENNQNLVNEYFNLLPVWRPEKYDTEQNFIKMVLYENHH